MEGLPKEDRTHSLGLLSSSNQHASRRAPGPMVKRSPETQATPHLWDCTLWTPGPYSQNILPLPLVTKHLLKMYSLGEHLYQGSQPSRHNPDCGGPSQAWDNSTQHEG